MSDSSDQGTDLGLGFAGRRKLRPKVPLRLGDLKSGLVPSPSSPDLHGSFNIPPAASLAPTRSRTLPKSYKKTVDYDVEPSPLTADEVRRVHRWILCIAIVNFDLDIGPVIHHLYPSVPLSPQQRENIAFSAFPDSSSFTAGAEGHSFRIRDPIAAQESRPVSLDGFIYGYALFLQKRDPLIRRGFLQKSVVVLSRFPHVSLFSNNAAKLGPLYFSHGSPMLETACRNIASWPDPIPGIVLELGFLGTVVQVELPSSLQEQQFSEITSFNEKFDPQIHILASVPSSSPLDLFHSALSSLWSIWECLVLGEAILVFSSSARSCSDAVWWLRDLIRPIPLAGDFRPYFTIHDMDFRTLVTKNKPPAGLVLGVTNPFFESACSHWPHILSVGKDESVPLRTSSRSRTSSGITNQSTQGPADMPTNATLLGPSSGWHSKHKRYISKDRALLKKLEEAMRTGSTNDASQLLRRHFSQQTEKLLVPLNRYFASLIPTDVTTVPTGGASVPLKAFNTPQFLASLKTHGAPLKFRLQGGGQKEFYEKFLKCSNFGSWLQCRVDLANKETAKLAAHTPSQRGSLDGV